MVSSFSRFLQDTQRRTKVSRTHLDEWLACGRGLYLSTHNTHNRQTSMLPVGFEPTISAAKRPQTYALDRAATGHWDRPNCSRTYLWLYKYSVSAKAVQLQKFRLCLNLMFQAYICNTLTGAITNMTESPLNSILIYSRNQLLRRLKYTFMWLRKILQRNSLNISVVYLIYFPLKQIC